MTTKEKELTLVALLRMPERVARGLRHGGGSLKLWCGDAVGAMWEAEFEGDPDTAAWEAEVKERWQCSAQDRDAIEGYDAGFVESRSEAERSIMRLLTLRADKDTDRKETGRAVAV